MKIKFYGSDGVFREEREYEIPTFEGNRGVHALKELLLAYQANLRQGNACTKTRGDVKGTGKKPYRQKGTGMARQGEKRSPIWRGGGVVFGPKPRDFSMALNKKEKRLALQRALFDAASDGKISVLEQLKSFEKPKTKQMEQLMHTWSSLGKTLLVDDLFETNALLSARNLDRVYTIDTPSLNAFDLCRFKQIVVTERALLSFLNRIVVKD